VVAYRPRRSVAADGPAIGSLRQEPLAAGRFLPRDLRATGRVRPRGLAPAYAVSAAQRKARLLRPESGNRHHARCDAMALAVILAAEPTAPALPILVPRAGALGIVQRGAAEVVRGVPVIDPFPDIAGHVMESVAVGWELHGRAVAVEAVQDAVLPGEAALP